MNIKKQISKEKNPVVKERMIAVSLSEEGMRNYKIGEILGRGRDTIGRWIKSYKEKGIEGLKEGRGGDHSSYLTESQKEELKEIIQKTYPIRAKGWSGDIIKELIEYRYEKKYTREGVYALLKGMNITYKKAKKVDPKKSERKGEEWKEESKKI